MSGRVVLALLGLAVLAASALLWSVGVELRPQAAVEWRMIDSSPTHQRLQLEWTSPGKAMKILVWFLRRSTPDEAWSFRQSLDPAIEREADLESEGSIKSADLPVAIDQAKQTWSRFTDLTAAQLRHWIRGGMSPLGVWTESLSTRRRAKRRVWFESRGVESRAIPLIPIAAIEQRSEDCGRTLLRAEKLAESEPARWRLVWSTQVLGTETCELRVIFADQTIEDLESP